MRRRREIDATCEQAIRIGKHLVLVRSVGEGPPVLLINGIGAHTRMWGLMERTLGEHRVLSFDAPGSGRSPNPGAPVSIPRLADLAAGVLDHFGVEQADAVGYSMGGIVLQQLLADHPQRVRRACLVATSPGLGGVYGPAMSLLNVSTPVRFLSDRLYLKSVAGLVGGRARHDETWVVEHLPVRLEHKPDLIGYSKQVLSLSGWSGLPLLARIGHPVLVIAGDDDPLTPVANGKLLARLLPQARLHVMHGEGHLMPLDDESAVPGMIRDYLDADDLDSAPVWRDGEVVTAGAVRVALGRQRFQLQPMPWGPISAMKRRRYVQAANRTP